MRDFIRLTDFTRDELFEIFKIADEIPSGKYRDLLKGKSAVLFFPASSVRTRVTFESGIYLLGGQPILFPTETLSKKEDKRDFFGYLNNWAGIVVIRTRDISVIEAAAEYLDVPVINGMTDVNHPCEILSDLYAFSKTREDFLNDKYLFCGGDGNIGRAWKEAADVFGLDLEQCCCKGCEMEGVTAYHNIFEAVQGKDIICTDSIPPELLKYFDDCRVTSTAMALANPGAVLNPCPPFYRGEEVSADAVSSGYFVGYGFKKHLLNVQQAVIVYCLIR